MAEIVVRLEIRGRVQGVGYRWAMVEKGRGLRLRGWVRNRRDGSVEALVAGPSEAVDRMVAWARQGPPSAAVDAVEVFAADAAHESLGRFEQRPTA